MRRTTVGATIAGIALTLATAACGSAGPGTTTAIRGPLPASIVINAVVSGSGEGWIVTDDAHLWRVSPDGSAASYPAPELAPMQAISATNFKGMVMVGGVRCKTNATPDTCPEVIGEVVAYKDGRKVWSTVVWKRAGPVYDGDGFAIIGPYKGALLLDTSAGLVAISADGSVAFRAPVAAGGTCVINGEIYAIRMVFGTTPDVTGDGPPVITDRTPRKVIIRALQGGAWVDVPSSGHEAPMGGGCSVDAFQLNDINGLAQATWTPVDGWRAAAPTPMSVDAAVGAFPASTHRRFLLTTGGELTSQQGASYRPTGLSFDIRRAPGSLPPMLAVDDSGVSLFACVAFSRSAPVCKVGAK